LTKIISQVNWKHGVKTALAAAICLVLSRALKLHQGYWACVSTIVVMQSETAATLISSRDRLVGTAVGALVGWGVASVWEGNFIAYGATVLLCMLIPELLGLKGAGRMAGVAATIILLVPSAVSHGDAARNRFLEVSFGILVALVVSQVLWRKTTVMES
jgi:uncharacterized membrane protein YgaE (UPF0421/DUF939 family)